MEWKWGEMKVWEPQCCRCKLAVPLVAPKGSTIALDFVVCTSCSTDSLVAELWASPVSSMSISHTNAPFGRKSKASKVEVDTAGEGQWNGFGRRCVSSVGGWAVWVNRNNPGEFEVWEEDEDELWGTFETLELATEVRDRWRMENLSSE